MHNAPDFAKTFKEIVGEENLVKQAFGVNNQDVDVLPLDGMPISSLTGSDGTPLTAYPTFVGGKADPQHYKGMNGAVYCTGTCELDGTTLKGDLYFRMVPGLRHYMKEGDTHDSEYRAFSIYGYRLYETAVDVGIQLIARTPTNAYGDVATADRIEHRRKSVDELAAAQTHRAEAGGGLKRENVHAERTTATAAWVAAGVRSYPGSHEVVP